LFVAPPAFAEPELRLSVGSVFAEQVDLEAFRKAAVLDDGRVKTVDSLAREKLRYVNASRAARDVDPVLFFLDLVLVPEHYAATNVVYIKKELFREQLVNQTRARLAPEERQGPVSDAELDRIVEEGWVSLRFLDHPATRSALSFLERDLMRTNKEVRSLESARALSDSHVLRSMLAMVPPPGGSESDPWISIDTLVHNHGGGVQNAGLDASAAASIRQEWKALEQAWRFQDAAAAGGSLKRLAAIAEGVEPALYPSVERRGWEHWYYRNNKMTWTWLVYFASVPFLLLAVIYKVRFMRPIGLGLFGLAFALHTFSIGLRWYLAGRVPNANMFEAIMAASWLGCLAALVLEVVLRRWPVRSLPAVAAAVTAMVAMMVGRFNPVIVAGSDIAPVMPVLDRTIWLYIHTNMVIASYALIFFASVTAVIYLGMRALAWAFPQAAYFQRALAGGASLGSTGAGAGTIILGRGMKPGDAVDAGLAKALDGATMIFLELAFISLWAGTILGAIWADVSWGRPWGWDPKEVFALNTWLVFLVLVHVRLKVKDKAFWTAVLAVIGCAVMLFNWIAVNFVIVGLHSYA
jgi:cytochrome c-type biogenesis protein CcsB